MRRGCSNVKLIQDENTFYGWYTVEDIKRCQTTPDLRLKQIKEEKKS